MAGRGPRPKDPSRRVRRDSSGIQGLVLTRKPAQQPELPEEIDWPDATRRWWTMWGESPQAEFFICTDWDFLLDTAALHADYWAGNLDRAGELRIRVAKFGATMEDQARLRMTFVEPPSLDDDEDDDAPASAATAQRYAAARPLRAVPDSA